MYWLQSINSAIHFIEHNITNKIGIEDISKEVYSSSAHFQRIFHLVTGITLGEYVCNRRLSLAGRDLQLGNGKVTEVAMRYQYDTLESFSKAFLRFHGIKPSAVKAKDSRLKFYSPLTINVSVKGGFDMSFKLIDEFCWSNIDDQITEALSDAEKYQMVIEWSQKARGQNPDVFDSLTSWILDDSQWTEDKLIENEQILMNGVLARFKEQNAKLRAYLRALSGSDVVNKAVWSALDRFDSYLAGQTDDPVLQKAVDDMFNDFSSMNNRRIRELIAGNATGSAGVNSVELYGYINCLKDCDAGVQWTLFMPQFAQRQQKGFQIESFEYRTMPEMRFIGKEFMKENPGDFNQELAVFAALDELGEYKSGFDYDILLFHHFGKGVDVEPCHGFLGRFMKAQTPVPQGFTYVDFTPKRNMPEFGPPYLSQFALAIFAGDVNAMHSCDHYDVDAMYDVTRNIILGQGVQIPYPHKYWTAEVFLDGAANPGTAYLFSVEL